MDLCSSARFLGVIFDSSLNWGPQLKSVKAKVAPRLNILRAMCGIKWGAHPDTLLRVYVGLIRSVLDYGSLCYGKMNAGVSLSSDRLQYAALRTCMGLMRTTPTNVILNLCGKWPLHIRRKFLLKKHILKCNVRHSHPLAAILREIVNSVREGNALSSDEFLYNCNVSCAFGRTTTRVARERSRFA